MLVVVEQLPQFFNIQGLSQGSTVNRLIYFFEHLHNGPGFGTSLALAIPSFIGSDVIGSDVIGSDVIGSDVIGSDIIGSDVIGSDIIGSDVIGSDVIGSDGIGR